MKRNANTLTLPLLVLLATLIVVIAVIKITSDRTDDAQRKFDAQRSQMRDAQARVQKSGTERDLITRYLPDYRKLDALGFIGDEQRICWLDALRHANQKGALFGINYDIAARKPYSRAAALNPGSVNVMQSLMKVRLQLLHEEDLPRFLANLAEPNAGVFLVNQCAMRRSGPSQTTRFLPNMTAECELAWITAQTPPLTEVRQ
jgi:hypothetical protein